MTLLEEAKRLLESDGRGRLNADSVAVLTSAARLSIEQLMLELIQLALTYAQPAISRFHVGAVALGSSGALYFGANIEFRGCALNQSVHAEQAAVINAAVHGETGLLKLAVSAPPCGYCRQFLNELATAAQLEVILVDKLPAKLSDYLPEHSGLRIWGLPAGCWLPCGSR